MFRKKRNQTIVRLMRNQPALEADTLEWMTEEVEAAPPPGIRATLETLLHVGRRGAQQIRNLPCAQPKISVARSKPVSALGDS